MALQEQLDRFKKQQEKCQSTLSKIVANKVANRTSSAPVVSPHDPANGRNPLPAVKFSNDTVRLQQIHNIRSGTVGSQLRLVIDLLKKTRKAFTAEQINEACYVDIKANKDVFENLRKNLKVHYDGQRFSYKPNYDVKDKTGLLQLIRKFTEGIALVDLEDAYLNVKEDLQALAAAGQIWLLSSFDSNKEIAYPNDPRLNIKVDDDLKQLFRSIELPRDMVDIEKDLQKNGMKPATNSAKRRSAAHISGIPSKPKPAKKRTGISKRTKLTNAHLPELFKDILNS